MYVLLQALLLLNLPQREQPVALKEWVFFLIEVAFKSSEPTFVGPGGGGVNCGGAGVELCGDGDSQEVHVQ